MLEQVKLRRFHPSSLCGEMRHLAEPSISPQFVFFVFFLFAHSSSVIHVPSVNDIQPSGSSNQNLAQITRQLNPGQVAWSGNRPPFSGQVTQCKENHTHQKKKVFKVKSVPSASLIKSAISCLNSTFTGPDSYLVLVNRCTRLILHILRVYVSCLS